MRTQIEALVLGDETAAQRELDRLAGREADLLERLAVAERSRASIDIEAVLADPDSIDQVAGGFVREVAIGDARVKAIVATLDAIQARRHETRKMHSAARAKGLLDRARGMREEVASMRERAQRAYAAFADIEQPMGTDGISTILFLIADYRKLSFVSLQSDRLEREAGQLEEQARQLTAVPIQKHGSVLIAEHATLGDLLRAVAAHASATPSFIDVQTWWGKSLALLQRDPHVAKHGTVKLRADLAWFNGKILTTTESGISASKLSCSVPDPSAGSASISRAAIMQREACAA